MHRFLIYICLAAFAAGWGWVGPAHASALDSAQQGPAPQDPVQYDHAQNLFCLKCHSNPDLTAVTEKGQGKDLLISEHLFSKGAHQKMSCQECHPGQGGQAGFNQVPHSFKNEKTMDCLECHPSVFSTQAASFKRSNHYQKLGSKMACFSCHNAHTLIKKKPGDGFSSGFYDDNKVCIECHTDLEGFKKLSGKDVFAQNFSHSFLPFKKKHFERVRCVDCHTPSAKTDIHMVLAKDQSLKDCTVCHADNSLVAARFFPPPETMDDIAGSYLGKGLFDDAELIKKLSALPIQPPAVQPVPDSLMLSGFVNNGLFADSYFIGASRDRVLDRTAVGLLGIVLALVIIHGCLRLFIGKKTQTVHMESSSPIYTRFIRWTHTANVLFFLILISTGFSMHFGAKSVSLSFPWSVDLHHLAAVLLVLNYLLFILAGLALGSLKSYWPSPAGAQGQMVKQAKYYLYGIFTGADHPFTATRDNRFNPLQKSVYLPLMFLGVPLLILSGAGMFFSENAPATLLGYPGKWAVSTLHYGLAVLFTAFVVIHVYLGTTGENAYSLFRNMFLGERREK